tara:strand:- start:1334 stop:1468 length:135 start_codon:yes stop_codon:yes gene_type:complete
MVIAELPKMARHWRFVAVAKLCQSPDPKQRQNIRFGWATAGFQV